MSNLSSFIDDMARADDFDARVWALWQTRKLDTVDIAARLGMHEWEVANRLLHLREKMQ